jgi:uncharacterized SAM-binding protein YcdF (DUF218 family)
MQAWRLPTGRIHLLGMCTNTRDEAERTAQLARRMGWHRVILVSSASHLKRAEATFRKAGLEVDPVGCDFHGVDRLGATQRWKIVPSVDGLLLCNEWVHEALGWWYYRLKGWA